MFTSPVYGKIYTVWCGNDAQWYNSDGSSFATDITGFNYKIDVDKSLMHTDGFILFGESYNIKLDKKKINIKNGVISYVEINDEGKSIIEIDLINRNVKHSFDYKGEYRVVKYCEKNIELEKRLAIKSKSRNQLEAEEKVVKQELIKQEQEAEAQRQVDSQQKKMETCQAYGFKKGSETFGECIFKLMELDLEYAKLENEQLRLEAQSEQARLNNDTALANSYSAQAQASNRDKALRIQQFGLAMQGIAKSFETPQSSITPKITCNKIGSITNCW